MQGYILLGIAIFTTVLSQLLFKHGMSVFGNVHLSLASVSSLLVNIIKNPFLLIGICFYAVSFVLWLLVLSKMKLSIAYPITSLNFVLALVASYFLFGEKLSNMQYAGIFLIIVGVIALARS